MPSYYHQGVRAVSLINEVREITGAMMHSDWEGPPRLRGASTRLMNHGGGCGFAMDDDPFAHSAEEGSDYELRAERYGMILDKVRRGGIDALAWYRSFHLEGGAWGIFIPESSLFFLADVVFGNIPFESEPYGQVQAHLQHERKPSADALAKALRLLWAHEIFHLATDLAVARWEVALLRPLWVFDRFRRKKEGVDYWLYEEQAANAHMLRYLRGKFTATDHARVEAFTLLQPPGYRSATEAVPDEVFLPLLEDLMRSKIGLLGVRAAPGVLGQGISAASFLDVTDEYLTAFDCPVHLVRDSRSVLRPPLQERIITCIPRIEESRRFLKQLSRMHSNYAQRWNRKKAELAERIPPHPEFEKFADGPPPVFSIRLSRSARAHLRQRQCDGAWVAIEVGEHTKMGHG